MHNADGYGVEDHRLFVVDFQERSLTGEAPFRIKRFTSRRLNTKVSSGATKISLKVGGQLEASPSHRTPWATSHHSQVQASLLQRPELA
jgi:hypothetical protein